MGRVKNSLIKRTARTLNKEKNLFNEGFDNNKKLLGTNLPSKRLRNQVAGYVTRLIRNEQKKQKRFQAEQNLE